MAITNNEKEAIDIVVDMINKRLKYLTKKEPIAIDEIRDFETTRDLILALEYLELE